jgi:hypothetical protein
MENIDSIGLAEVRVLARVPVIDEAGHREHLRQALARRGGSSRVLARQRLGQVPGRLLAAVGVGIIDAQGHHHAVVGHVHPVNHQHRDAHRTHLEPERAARALHHAGYPRDPVHWAGHIHMGT